MTIREMLEAKGENGGFFNKWQISAMKKSREKELHEIENNDPDNIVERNKQDEKVYGDMR